MANPSQQPRPGLTVSFLRRPAGRPGAGVPGMLLFPGPARGDRFPFNAFVDFSPALRLQPPALSATLGVFRRCFSP